MPAALPLLCYLLAIIFALLGAFNVPGRVNWLALSVALALIAYLMTVGTDL